MKSKRDIKKKVKGHPDPFFSYEECKTLIGMLVSEDEEANILGMNIIYNGPRLIPAHLDVTILARLTRLKSKVEQNRYNIRNITDEEKEENAQTIKKIDQIFSWIIDRRKYKRRFKVSN
jgi:hypothetical protein